MALEIKDIHTPDRREKDKKILLSLYRHKKRLLKRRNDFRMEFKTCLLLLGDENLSRLC